LVQARYRALQVPDLRIAAFLSGKEADVEEKDTPRGERRNEDLDVEMERDTEIRRDTQVRSSLGIPPSGSGSRDTSDRDESIPEFDRGGDEDRMSER
jgi:hypothetical protein